jgi:AcrR family transcriptional regulator
MPRKRQNHEIKQKEFINAAQVLFFTKGYESTSIQDILKAVGGEAGLSPSVFYYYFSSKDEIFEYTVNEYIHSYTQDLIKVIKNTALNYSNKIEAVLIQVRKAVEDFTKIDSYFDRNDIQSKRFNQIIDINVRSDLTKPLSRFLNDAVENNIIPVTPLLKEAGTEMLAEMMLWAIYPMFHQKKESDGKYHNEKYLKLMPLLFLQILGLPSE